MKFLFVLAACIAAVSAQCDSEPKCSCCCYGDNYMPQVNYGSTTTTAVTTDGGSGWIPASMYECGDGAETKMCCGEGMVNTVNIMFSGDVEALIDAGNIDANSLIADVVNFLLENTNTLQEDILQVTVDGNIVQITLANTVDPENVQAIQTELNSAIEGNASPFASTDLTASAGTATFEDFEFDVVENKQIPNVEFCDDRRVRRKKGKEGSSVGSKSSKGKKGEDDDCIDLNSNSGKKGKKNKKDKKGKSDKKGKKDQLTATSSNVASPSKYIAIALISAGVGVVLVTMTRKLMAKKTDQELTEHAPLLKETVIAI